MASAISLEYLQSIEGAADGLATLDGTGKVPVSQLPTAALEVYVGEYATEAALVAAYPTASRANYAYVVDTLSFWYWNADLGTPAWVNQEITSTAYLALSTAERSALPYIIVP